MKSSVIETTKEARYWWLFAIVALAVLALGLYILYYPAVSYQVMALLFGWTILASGVLSFIYSVWSPGAYMRWWGIAGGVIESVIGVVLLLHPALSQQTLPLFLGFWLLLRSFSLIGNASQMNQSNVPGSGWAIFTSLLLILCAFMIFMEPYSFQVAAVVVWVGFAFIIAGVSMLFFAFQVRKL